MISDYCVRQCSSIYTCIIWKKIHFFNNKNAYPCYGLGYGLMTNCHKNPWPRKCLFHIAQVYHELAGRLAPCLVILRPRLMKSTLGVSLVTIARGKRWYEVLQWQFKAFLLEGNNTCLFLNIIGQSKSQRLEKYK